MSIFSLHLILLLHLTDILTWRKTNSWNHASAKFSCVGASNCGWGNSLQDSQQHEACLHRKHIAFKLVGRPYQWECQQGKQGWAFPTFWSTWVPSQRNWAAKIAVSRTRSVAAWKVFSAVIQVHGIIPGRELYSRELKLKSFKSGVVLRLCHNYWHSSHLYTAFWLVSPCSSSSRYPTVLFFPTNFFQWLFVLRLTEFN